ncbi:rCG50383 [Rattus norvegicus]|uniref:RCG50383 n=1 Tax=Rattus norvegicus TaxID=10116 RepID=A6JYY3_RAT|nr:rCG50383 [Rattus norvegicus]
MVKTHVFVSSAGSGARVNTINITDGLKTFIPYSQAWRHRYVYIIYTHFSMTLAHILTKGKSRYDPAKRTED